MSNDLQRLGDEKYVQLTTFRKNGKAVPTPVWIVRVGDELRVWSERDAGKVKRIRNNGTVELTACDMRGRTTHGETVTGKAYVLDDAASDEIRAAIKRKYGLVGKITMLGSQLRGGKERTVGVGIRLTPA